jgi:hypothetical protein
MKKSRFWKDPGRIENAIGLAIVAAGLLLLFAYILLK